MSTRGIASALLVVFLSGCVTGEAFISRDQRNPDRQTNVYGSLRKPEGRGPFPLVVLLQSCGGSTSTFTSHWPRVLEKMGYASFTVDSLGARGARTCGQGSHNKILGLWDVIDDAYGALDHLKRYPELDTSRAAVMGFSMGAMAINEQLLTNTDRRAQGDFVAAISFYGTCSRINAGDIQPWRPVLELAGSKDTFHGPSCTALTGKSPYLEVHTFEGVYHAFDELWGSGEDGSGHKMVYDEKATKESEGLVEKFLRKAFAK
jgi:dienelactone hydrolase